MKEPLLLDKAFQDILQQLELQKDHFFVTGKAGTGKSTLLQLPKFSCIDFGSFLVHLDTLLLSVSTETYATGRDIYQ